MSEWREILGVNQWVLRGAVSEMYEGVDGCQPWSRLDAERGEIDGKEHQNTMS
jgi:hypothetical protein